MGAFKRFSKTLSLRTSSSFRSSNNNNNSTKRSSSTSSKKLIPKKSVSFSDEISSLHHVERFDNSAGDLWFTKLEELAFKQRDFDLCHIILSTIMMPNLDNDDDIESQLGESCRGLEYNLNEFVQRQIALRRQTSLHAVLHTQDKCRRCRRNGAQLSLSGFSFSVFRPFRARYNIFICRSVCPSETNTVPSYDTDFSTVRSHQHQQTKKQP